MSAPPRAFLRRIAACAAALIASHARASAQVPLPPVSVDWRATAAGVGTSARVLIVGAHPDDEDNALIAWASLGRHIETAYLSLTRGESGVNLLGHERASLLSMVRTAEALAERQRDGAHQYFTRAYDFGYARNDSVAWAAWPRDSLLRDVTTAIRVFRPQVVISLFPADSTNRDGQHQVAGELAREAFLAAGDTLRLAPSTTGGARAWAPTAFYQIVDSAGPSGVRIDVGALDGASGSSYAELGAEIRRLQRTQPQRPAPPVGPVYRYLRREELASAADPENAPPPAADTPSLFAGVDTTWARFSKLSLNDTARTALDSLTPAVAALSQGLALDGDDSVVARLARVVRLATAARATVRCAEPNAANCAAPLADLALTLSATRDRAGRALLDASGIVVDARVEREAVAVGDSVRATLTVYNGGTKPVRVSRVAIVSSIGGGFARADSAVIAPDSSRQWSGLFRMFSVSYAGWLTLGLQDSSWIYLVAALPGRLPVNQRLLLGEDRMTTSDGYATLTIGEASGETSVVARGGRLMGRDSTTLRGDLRHPVAGMPQYSVLLERAHEYVRATAPVNRLERVYVASAGSKPDSVRVSILLPKGLVADTPKRTVLVPAFGGRTVFFRVTGTQPTGTSSFSMTAEPLSPFGPDHAAMREFRGAGVVTDGVVSFEYPHIPTQRLPVNATDSLRVVDVQYPRGLRVAYVRPTRDDELDGRLAELGIPAFPIDASQLGVADVSFYSTILIGARAFAQVEALAPNAGALRRFAERGGTVVVLSGRDELTAPGILPYPIAFAGPNEITALDPERAVRVLDSTSPLLTWPNRITQHDFDEWVGRRARELPSAFDPHYHPVLELLDDNNKPTAAAILSARVGKGTFIYTSLSLEQQIVVATNAGAARLLVNLLCAGMPRGATSPAGR